MKRLGSIFRYVLESQEFPYNIEPDMQLLTLLKHCQTIDEKTAYAISKELEPPASSAIPPTPPLDKKAQKEKDKKEREREKKEKENERQKKEKERLLNKIEKEKERIEKEREKKEKKGKGEAAGEKGEKEGSEVCAVSECMVEAALEIESDVLSRNLPLKSSLEPATVFHHWLRGIEGGEREEVGKEMVDDLVKKLLDNCVEIAELEEEEKEGRQKEGERARNQKELLSPDGEVQEITRRIKMNLLILEHLSQKGVWRDDIAGFVRENIQNDKKKLMEIRNKIA
uniref:Uncharacterized protein n=1 Tax=Paramoeba aestuarina TaxID=180227 RepID=A0A7S4P8V9_9EUKA|mmetsp:Transcript_38169/g.60404  ORF Transcript_38169/g.60404 Transcript_38169/m.60404 type:complete len:284 (+) Transcript_38169:247-1098(+)